MTPERHAWYLVASPPATPTPWQVALVRQMAHDCAAAGLKLPRRFVVRWRQGVLGDERAEGCVDRSGEDIVVYLRVDAWNLARTMAHELYHVHATLTGARDSMTEEQEEHAARVFADEMLLGPRLSAGRRCDDVYDVH